MEWATERFWSWLASGPCWLELAMLRMVPLGSPLETQLEHWGDRVLQGFVCLLLWVHGMDDGKYEHKGY